MKWNLVIVLLLLVSCENEVIEVNNNIYIEVIIKVKQSENKIIFVELKNKMNEFAGLISVLNSSDSLINKKVELDKVFKIYSTLLGFTELIDYGIQELNGDYKTNYFSKEAYEKEANRFLSEMENFNFNDEDLIKHIQLSYLLFETKEINNKVLYLMEIKGLSAVFLINNISKYSSQVKNKETT